MGELQKTRMPGTIHPNMIPLSGTMEITAAGAILTQSGNRDSGVTFTRNATGDYRATLHRGYARCFGGDAAVIMPGLGTVPTLAAGNDAFINGISAANMNGTSPISSFGIATSRSDSDALADPTSGVFIAWTLWVSDSK
jgi:hypothetical protein